MASSSWWRIFPGLYEAKLIRSGPTRIKEFVHEKHARLVCVQTFAQWHVYKTCETKSRGSIQWKDKHDSDHV